MIATPFLLLLSACSFWNAASIKNQHYAFTRCLPPIRDALFGTVDTQSLLVSCSNQPGDVQAPQTTDRKRRRDKAQIVTCSSSRELIRAISTHVRPDDTVAELGAQLRDVSSAICDQLHHRQGEAVMVDVARKFPSRQDEGRASAMRLQGDEAFESKVATFQEVDHLNDWRRAFFFSRNKKPVYYDVFVVDVSGIIGNDLWMSTLALVQEFLSLNQYQCRVVLVKSTSLNSLACRLAHGEQWIQGNWIETPLRPLIVATVGVQQYRDTIPLAVKPGDAALEVGCHKGTTTSLLYQHVTAAESVSGGYCIGIDVGPDIIERAKKQYPYVAFAVGDAWRTLDLLRIQTELLKNRVNGDTPSRTLGFDVVYVDVGGLSGSDGLFEALTLLSSIENGLEPRCIVIKSLCVRRLSSRLVSYWLSQKRRREETTGP